MPPPVESPSLRGSSHLAYNLAGIATLVLLVAIAAAYGIDQANRTTRPLPAAISDGDAIVQTIAGRELTIPASWFRYGEQIKSGFASQVDLRVHLDLFAAEPPTPVDVTLLPRSRARASSVLLDTVYLHQFADGLEGGVPGLVGKPLSEGNGYAGENVWYDALSPNPFVAKCAAAVEAGQAARCVRTVQLPSGLAAIFTFDATALHGWREFDGHMAQWLGRIGAL